MIAKYFHTILLNPQTGLSAIATFYKLGNWGSSLQCEILFSLPNFCMFQCNSNLGNFSQKGLSHKPFLWNIIKKKAKRNFYVVLKKANKNQGNIKGKSIANIKIARPKKKSPKTKTQEAPILVPAATNTLLHVCAKSRLTYEELSRLIHTKKARQSKLTKEHFI